MSRTFLTFTVGEDVLHATLDAPFNAARDVGLLIVSGGNEIRSGAFAGQSSMARHVADHGYPAFRFDRRGIGDSEGENGEFRSTTPDIAAAVTAFRTACPALRRIVAFGNCDGAASLMLAQGAGCDALVLANPWTFDEGNEDSVPAEAVRRRYLEKLANPREWKRLLSGKVSISGALGSLKGSIAKSEPISALGQELLNGLADYTGEYRCLVAGRDRTGLAFKGMWPQQDRIAVCPTADHAFSGADETTWLEEKLLSTLDEQARQLDMG